MPAPAYNSYKWIQEDWRYLKLVKGDLFSEVERISYDKRCGEKEKGYKGATRLCLPRIVIQRLIKTNSGKKALLQQMKKKLASKKKKVSWNDTVKKAMKKFSDEQKKKGIKDDPTKRKRAVSRNRTKPNVWNVRYVQKSSPRIIQNKFYEIKKFTDKKQVEKRFKEDKKRTQPFLAKRIKIVSIDKTYNTYYK